MVTVQPPLMRPPPPWHLQVSPQSSPRGMDEPSGRKTSPVHVLTLQPGIPLSLEPVSEAASEASEADASPAGGELAVPHATRMRSSARGMEDFTFHRP